MEMAKAGRCIVDASSGYNEPRNKEFEMTAFLNIFHPELGAEKIREYAQDAGKQRA